MSEGELWIVRHGETEWSRSGRHTSSTDLDLTEDGERVARTLRDRLAEESFDLVLTSPLLRTRRTAELAGFTGDRAAQEDPDLVEWDYGDYEGMTTPEIREQDPGWTVWTHPCPGGESAEEVTARMDRVVARVHADGGTSLVFCHGHASRALAARWLDQPVSEGGRFILGTATVSVLGYEHGVAAVSRWNC